MKKSELAAQLAEKTGMSKVSATSALGALTDLVTEELVRGGKVQLTGLGTLSVRQRKERMGVNPATGEKIKIPAKKVAAFKASSTLTDSLK